MTNNEALKRNARAQLGGNIFANEWLMFMVCALVVGVISSVATSAAFVAYLLVAGPLEYGMARIAVKRACNIGSVDMRDLLASFHENIGDVIILGIVRMAYIFLWALLFIVPGIVKSYSYSMAFYIKQDDPGKGWRECLAESSDMMKGYRWQLFCIDVTMFLWTLLGSLVVIGGLFVTPYKEMSHANFYLARKATY